MHIEGRPDDSWAARVCLRYMHAYVHRNNEGWVDVKNITQPIIALWRQCVKMKLK